MYVQFTDALHVTKAGREVQELAEFDHTVGHCQTQFTPPQGICVLVNKSILSIDAANHTQLLFDSRGKKYSVIRVHQGARATVADHIDKGKVECYLVSCPKSKL